MKHVSVLIFSFLLYQGLRSALQGQAAYNILALIFMYETICFMFIYDLISKNPIL